MGHAFRHFVWGQFLNQRQVPATQGRKGVQSLGGIVSRVAAGPFVLIERLNRVIVLCQRLAIGESKSQLTIRQMNQNFAGAPFS